ncbi:hypothetical protein SU69_02200 [Thermosipho melanesiensis]|uniref:Uncharacterized protein n=2 Tax=Thermosipho melanesiensis TaxID=46541 RepID=A6LK39_THEM4|nr:hypothetical protein [Thermosipho melanesiensis]ABR30290.1 hypothetical protein Tmel_0422 [Thermosipho melanesiensis BI429]APT74820.1 hypothetical protein BW47_02300 [Thermosipho melanesiensis]OOC37413.1 hypothetical protein SU68_02210 [Thermosipho melanesiensis]OOC39775.1 hypothetical protein SU69_02200 [Thermosipho melanesiensis]OOC39880.1 hypothetical protein SU70_02195 [Thermosipho melanesiensis]
MEFISVDFYVWIIKITPVGCRYLRLSRNNSVLPSERQFIILNTFSGVGANVLSLISILIFGKTKCKEANTKAFEISSWLYV